MKRTVICLLLGLALMSGCKDEPDLEALYDGMSFYYGNFHSHSKISDGKGSPAEAFSWARDEAGYDFYAMTDHAIQIFGSEWEAMGENAEIFNQDDEFIAIRGFEWSSPIHGHICIYGTDDYRNNALLPTLTGIYDWIDARGALAQFNHPGREARVFRPLLSTQEFDYRAHVADNFFAMETGNKGVGNNDSEYLDYYHVALDQGWRIAPTSNQDNHSLSTNSHRSIVIAEELTREAIFEGMTARRVLSGDDPNLEVIFKQGQNWMGSEIELNQKSVTFEIYVRDDEPLTKLQLISNGGEIVAEKILDDRPETFYWKPCVKLPRGESYYFVQVFEENILDEDDDVQITVTAPIWISRN